MAKMTADEITKDTIWVKNAEYIVCPKCGDDSWSSMYKDYNGTVYCKARKCNHRFKPNPVTLEEYSVHCFTNDKDGMIKVLEDSLKLLKGTK